MKLNLQNIDDNESFVANFPKKKPIPAKIEVKENNDKQTYNISIRTDGLGPEHFANTFFLENTFKIKVKNNNIKNLKEFRIIKAKNVDYEIPFLFNYLLNYFDLISRKYIPIQINQTNNFTKDSINHYMEESVDKNLLERLGLRQGFLFSFDLFKRKEDLENLSKYRKKIISSEEFEKRLKKSSENSKLISNQNSNEVQFAFSNFNSFMTGKKSYTEVFDKNSLYSYLLISILWNENVTHHLQLHNIEFYFDPLSKKIHLIGKDPWPIYENKNPSVNLKKHSFRWVENIFLDENFYQDFHLFLKKHLLDNKLEKYINDFTFDYSGYVNRDNKSILLKNINHLSNKFKDISSKEQNDYNIISNFFDVKETNFNKFTKPIISNDIFTVDDSQNVIFLKNSKTKIKKNEIIPDNYSNYTFFILPGQKIFFENYGSLTIYSKVSFIGEENNKINLISQTKKSFIFIKNDQTILKDLKISNFDISAINKEIYFYTSPISLISKDLQLKNIEIINSKGEDSINIINSNIKLKNIDIPNSTSDALDIDNSYGIISDMNIKNCKNDCLDISSSNLSITNIKISNSLDKNISIGENSNISLSDSIIDNCNKVCIAVKDQSTLNLNNISVSNGLMGIAMFIKKNIFNNSYIKSKNLKFNNITYKLVTDENIKKNNHDLDLQAHKITIDELY